MAIKGLLLLRFRMERQSNVLFYSDLELKCRSKVFFYSDLELLEWRSNVLFYFDLDWNDYQKSSSILMSIKGLLLLWSGIEMLIKGLLLLWSGIAGRMIKGLLLLWFRIARMTIKSLLLLSCRSKVFFYFDLDLLEWRLKVFFYSDVDQRSSYTLIWNCWNDNQRSSSTLFWNGMTIKGPLLLWSRMEWQSKFLFCFDVDQRSSFTLIWDSWNVDQRSFSTSIWNCWNDNQRSSSTLIWNGMTIKGPLLIWFGIAMLPVKSQELELDFNWKVLCGPTVFEMCDFHLLILDLNFIKKSLIDKRFFFWETFDFWYLEVLKFLFQILRLWNLEILTWNLKFWALKFWKLRLGIMIMKSKVWFFFFFN